MAELLTIQDSIDGRLDIKSLGEAANGDENTQIITRTGETYPSAKKAIKTMFANGGLPAQPFATKALMTASALANGSYAQVTEDATEANNGLYYKSQGSWAVSKYNPLLQAQNFANGNPLFKPVTLMSSDNLDSFRTTGFFIKYTSGDINLANNYPVKLAGVLRIEAAYDTACIQEYTVFSTGVRYRRYILPSTPIAFSSWKMVDGKDFELKYLTPIEWQGSVGAKLTYDSTTRTVSLKNLAIASYANSFFRIKINAFSKTLSGDYDVCYLDLKALGSVVDIETSDINSYIKVGTYGTASNRYFAEAGQIPLFKFDASQGKAVSCAGFLPMHYDTESSSDAKDTGTEFEKTVDNMNVYFSQASGKKLQVGFRRFVRGAGDTSYGNANSDLWRIHTASRASSTNNIEKTIVNAGEWELAITHQDDTQPAGVAKDHVGGYHGDEIKTDIKFLIDGVLRDESFLSVLTKAKEIQIIQHSVIYFQNTTRPLCDHIKNITFKDGKINVKQRIHFKYEAVALTTAWISMLPILRVNDGYKITDKSARSNDYFLQVDDNSAASFTQRYTPVYDGLVVKQWSEANEISSTMTMIKTANADISQSMYVSSSVNYNKIYISAKDASNTLPTTVPINSIWNTETEYDIKC